MRKSKVPTYTLSSLDLALDYPGSLGAMYVETWRGVLMPKQIVLTTPAGKYHFFAVTGSKPAEGNIARVTDLEVSELMTRDEAYAYARFILHIPDEPVWLALVG